MNNFKNLIIVEKDIHMSKKIFVGNYKGGVGKTTSVYSIAVNMSKQGKKVLLLDLDPQSSLSEICMRNFSNSKSNLSLLEPHETLNYIYDMYLRKIKTYKGIELKFKLDCLIKKGTDIYFIPSSLFYKNGGLDELSLKMENKVDYLSILKQFVDNIENEKDFDYIFIDCPPSSNVMTQGAFLMSDYYMIPTVLDGMSTNGVIHYINTINETYMKYCDDNYNEDALFNKHFFGCKPKLIGIFYTLIRGQANYDQDRTNFKNSLKQLKSESNIYLFKNYINNYIDIARNISQGEISRTKSEDYKKLTKELIERVNSLEEK